MNISLELYSPIPTLISQDNHLKRSYQYHTFILARKIDYFGNEQYLCTVLKLLLYIIYHKFKNIYTARVCVCVTNSYVDPNLIKGKKKLHNKRLQLHSLSFVTGANLKKKTNNPCGALLHHMPYHFSYQWHGPKSKSDTTRPIKKRRIVEGWRELWKWCQSKEEGAEKLNTNKEEIKADDSIARFVFFKILKYKYK